MAGPFAPLRSVHERSAMNANPKFLAQTARVDDAAVKPMPNSRKVYVESSRRDLRVPMREIVQSDTPASFGAEKNPPLFVYDTSGPYTDPQARIDIRQGLLALRAQWIEERGDTEELPGPTSRYGHDRLSDPKLADMRFHLKRKPRRARPGRNVTQMHYARKGMVTPEMEFIAIRENQRRDALSELITRQHRGEDFDELHFGRDHALSCVMHLRHVPPGPSAARFPLQVEAHVRELWIAQPVVTVS